MNRQQFRDLAASKLIILDGATGTQLALRGMPSGVCPEEWILENPEAIIDLQSLYRQAGSDIVYAPTFGGNRCKLEEFGLEDRLEEINTRLVELSRKAAGDGYVFGDLAPTGRFVEPFGDMAFDEAVAVFREQVQVLLKAGVDGFVIETMIDIQEARAALLAVRESCDLPAMVSMTFEKEGRTLTGSDPVTALVTLQSLGADAVGCNCSTGPESMIEVIRSIKPYATVPLLAKPNAGLPRLRDGKTVFDMNPADFASHLDEFLAAGVNILGGCCGTSPDHIKAVVSRVNGRCGEPARVQGVSAVSSARKTAVFAADRPLAIVGERINPTGKKDLQAELREGRLDLVQQFAREQAEQGADVLDVNMGLSGIDAADMMCRAVRALSVQCDLPLAIDSTDPAVVERALRLYPGRALLNSISGEKERIEKMLPLAAKYGAMFILLPLTDQGIPATADERVAVVESVMKEARALGCHDADVLVDGLVMTISSDQQAAAVTLDTIERCSRDLGLRTICGLSNVSFGLPQRQWVNAAFLLLAAGRGLTAAIANPSLSLLMDLKVAGDALLQRDAQLQGYIGRFAGQSAASTAATVTTDDPAKLVYQTVLRGEEQAIAGRLQKALDAGLQASSLVDDCLIPAINEVGEKYDRKEYFLPQLIMSADTMRKGFEFLEPLLAAGKEGATAGPLVVMATVKGDIHDIGKNIVCLMLRNYGFRVIDLGKDVAAERIVNEVKQSGAGIVGLSALMTTTMTEMRVVIGELKAAGLENVKVMIGGAVVDQAYADEIGADAYSSDAMDAVRVAGRLAGA